MLKRHITVGDIRLNSQAKIYLNRIIQTNRLTYGPFARKFEAEFAKFHHRRWAIFTSSGTGALLAGLATLKELNHWPDGSEILVPAVSFVSTANIVYQLRLTPVFVDVDRRTYNLDPNQLIKHLTDKTRAIIPVHALGLPADMIAISAFAKKHHLKVFEDSCDTMFVGINRRPVGSFGDLAAFSTYVAHLLPTGVGGFLVGDSLKMEAIARSYIFHGRHSSYLSIDDDSVLSLNTLKKRFCFDRIGFNFRLTEMEAAIGLSQLEKNRAIKAIKIRQRFGLKLIQLLQPLADKLQLPFIPHGFNHAFMMFPLLLKDPSVNKWSLLMFLEKNGIETRELLPLLNQPAYKKTFKIQAKNYPNADYLNRRGFYFGCHQGMNLADIHYLAEKLYEFFSK